MIEGRNFRLKRIPAALRGSGGGYIDPVQAALNRFSFHAPLTKSVILSRGVGAASYTRATVATVKDFEGNIRNVLSGEVRFEGQRRVHNRVPHSTDFSNAGWTATNAPTLASSASVPSGTTFTASNKVTAATGASRGYNFSTLTVGEVYIISCWLKGEAGGESVYLSDTAGSNGTFTVDTTWRRYSRVLTAGNTQAYFAIQNLSGSDKTVYFVGMQVERVIGQSNQNPSEYVSVGAAKLNYLVNTELLSAWSSSGTLAEVINGMLGNAVAWDLTDDNAAAYEFKSQSVTVPNDGSTWYLRYRLKKTSGGTAPVPGVNLSLSGGVGVGANLRVHPETGVVTTGSAYSVVDGGTYWEVTHQIVNNATGNTTLSVQILPAVMPIAGPYVDGVANTGTNTFAAFEITKDVPPSDYFPVGNVYPFHGACVDGVKYFDYENGNTVSSNVVTEATGRSLDGYSVGHIPGAATDYFEAATTATTRPSGNTEVEIEWIGLWQTGTSSTSVLCSYGDGGAVGLGFLLTINNGILTWYLSTTGAAWDDAGRVATTTVPFANNTLGRIKWVRTTAGVNSFYYSLDRGANWTKIGNDVSAASGAIFPTTLGYRFGEWSGGWAGHGRFLRGIIRDTTAGTTLADFNPREGWTENLLVNSVWAGAGSPYTPTSWAYSAATGTTSSAASGLGGVYAANTALTFTVSTSRQFLSPSSALNVVVGDIIESSCMVEAVSGLVYQQVIGSTGTYTATSVWKLNGAVVNPADFVAGTGRLTVEWTVTAAGTFYARHGAGTASNATGSVTLSAPMVRRLSIAGQRTTSQYLPTTTAALRGWISSTGEQWTINGAATVLQRQAEGYLPEGASANLVLQSSNFGTTWLTTGTPTRSAAAKYCGDIALDLIGDDTAAVVEEYYQQITFTADAVKSISFLIAQGTSTKSVVRLRDSTAATNRLLAEITWSSGTPSIAYTTGSQERAPEALGNGVFRIFMVTSSVTAANTNYLSIVPASDATFAIANTGDVYVGGVQAENATGASSLIPTTTGTVTRNVEYLTYPAAGNVSSTQGALYGEIYALNSGTYRACITAQRAALTDRVELALPVAGAARGTTYAGGAAQADITAGAFSVGLNKFASRYAANDFQVAGNGTLGTPDAAGSVPTVTTIYLGIRSDSWPTAVPIKNIGASMAKLNDEALKSLTRTA